MTTGSEHMETMLLLGKQVYSFHEIWVVVKHRNTNCNLVNRRP